MNPESDMHITIEYQLIDSTNWDCLELTPEDYFELELDEKIDLDSIPKYNHAIDYLDLERNQIQATKLILTYEATKAKHCIIERFWNQGENRLIERIDSGVNPYWEMILEIQISQEPLLWEIVRIGREDGIMKPLYHAFIQDNKDGSQTETKIQK